MSDARPARGPARIVRLAIATAPERTRHALQTAVSLASALQRELTVTYVRDEDLLRAAALPCTWEVSTFAGGVRPFEVPDVERLLRREAAAVERMIAQAAQGLGLPWTFSIDRGRLFDLSYGRAAAEEILVVGERSLASRGEVGQAQAVIIGASVAEAVRELQPLLGTLESGARLTVWIPRAGVEEVRAVQARLAGTRAVAGAGRSPQATIRTDRLDPDALQRVLRETRPALVVVPRDLDGDLVAEIMAALRRQTGTLVVMP